MNPFEFPIQLNHISQYLNTKLQKQKKNVREPVDAKKMRERESERTPMYILSLQQLVHQFFKILRTKKERKISAYLFFFKGILKRVVSFKKKNSSVFQESLKLLPNLYKYTEITIATCILLVNIQKLFYDLERNSELHWRIVSYGKEEFLSCEQLSHLCISCVRINLTISFHWEKTNLLMFHLKK